jgi:PAS domain-containing protein
MNSTAIPTEFAPADRASKDVILRDYNDLCSLEIVRSVIDSMPQIVFVLNQNRQIVYANRVFYELFHVDDAESVLGLRPGELLGCTHGVDAVGGCGTTKSCQSCGAVLAILNSLEGDTDTRTCHIFRKADSQVFELQIKAAPFIAMKGNTPFSIVSALMSVMKPS